MLDHDAIHRAYPQWGRVSDEEGAFDKDGTKIEIEQSKVDEARASIDAELAAVKYKSARSEAYASIGDQLDMQYWDAVNGTTTWKNHVSKVKSDNPKPS